MRSRAEILFRARQELANLYLLIAQPALSSEIPLTLSLPDAEKVAARLRGSAHAEGVERIAERLLEHRFPLLGLEIETGRPIHWRRDYVHAKESGGGYFRRIPYLDFSAVGDHKVIWELNRHQHLVLLAQAFVLTGRQEFKNEVFLQLESWFEGNPFQHGINWASALEVAFRALSWIWLYHLLALEMTESFRHQLLTGLYRHGRHLRENLSVYFSPNTHLLGEAVALHAIGKLFPDMPEAAAWVKRGKEIVAAQLEFQVLRDGAHFEQSTYYHVYALDFFLWHYLLEGRPAAFEPVLRRMAEYLFWLLGPQRRIAFLGDDDGGRLFHPYGSRDQFGRATLTTCGLLLQRPDWVGTEGEIAEQAAWWLGAETLEAATEKPATAQGSRLFADSGAAFLAAGNWRVQMDCGPFGWAGAGHSHSDSLSVLLSEGEEWVLIDPGTYTYLAEPEQRNWFRGSAAHNTVRIDSLNQGRSAGPFRWTSKPEVTLTRWLPQAANGGGAIEAICRYEQFTHRRRILLTEAKLLIWDRIDGPPAHEHVGRQIWQLGPGARQVDFVSAANLQPVASNFSPAYGARFRSESLVAEARGTLPLEFALVIHAGGTGAQRVDAFTLDECARAWEKLAEPTDPQ